MKTLKVFFLFILLTMASMPVFSQVAIMGDVSGTPFSETPEQFSTWKFNVRYGITEDLTATAFFRSSRSRMMSVPNPKSSPSNAGLLGIYYRINPFFRFGLSAGLQDRRDPGTKELGWIIGGDVFFGAVSETNYYLKKQAFGYAHIEKGQWDEKVYADAYIMFPLLSFFAGGVRFESDMGFGPHVEIKIPIGEEQEMRAIYLYGTYFSDSETKIKTPVIGVRISVN